MFRLFAAVFFFDVARGSASPSLECMQKCMGFEKGGPDFVAVYDDWPKPNCEWWREATECIYKCSQDDRVIKWFTQNDLPDVLDRCQKGTAPGFFDSMFKYIKAVKGVVPMSECASIEMRTPDNFCEFYMCIWGKILVPIRANALTAGNLFAGQILKLTYAFNQNGRWFIYPMPQKCVEWVTDRHLDVKLGEGETDNK